MTGNIPSLDLSFDWVKDVLVKQSHVADTLDTKGTNLFSVATLVLGVGISAGVIINPEVSALTITTGVLALISYFWVAVFAFNVWRLRSFDMLDNPIIIREEFWDLEPQKFKEQILSHLEDAYADNESELEKKTEAVRNLLASTILEVMFLFIALISIL